MPGLNIFRSGLFAVLIDQAIVSAGGFGLNVLLARGFSENNYGVFTLILSFVLFLNTLHQAFVTFPLSVQSAADRSSRLGYFLTVAAMLTFLEAYLFFPVVGGVALSVKRLALVPGACLFMIAWQLQEVWRRGLIARSRYLAVIGNDVVRYILPLATLVLIAQLDLLSLRATFLLLAVVSLVACLPMLRTLPVEYRDARRNLKREVQAHWRLASPVLGANLLAAFSTQWFLWVLAWGHNLESSATLVALANIVGFSSPVMFGLENILVPEIARQRDTLSFPDLMALVWRRGIVGGLLVAPFFLIVLIWPGPVLRLFYGADKDYAQFAAALQILAGAYITYLAGYILSATLRGCRSSTAVFKMQLYPALLGLSLGSWLTLRYGVSGACLAALIAGSVRVGIGCYHVSRLREATLASKPAYATDLAGRA